MRYILLVICVCVSSYTGTDKTSHANQSHNAQRGVYTIPTQNSHRNEHIAVKTLYPFSSRNSYLPKSTQKRIYSKDDILWHIQHGPLTSPDQHEIFMYVQKYSASRLFTSQEQKAIVHQLIPRKCYMLLYKLYTCGISLHYRCNGKRSVLDRLFNRSRCLKSAPCALAKVCIHEHVPITKNALKLTSDPKKYVARLDAFRRQHPQYAQNMIIHPRVQSELNT